MDTQSTYETAPATIMLATHCAACGRPLVDSVSVESGMGPECREKYGRWPAEIDRVAVNRLVHEIAMEQACDFGHASALHMLGAVRIVSRVANRFATVLTETEGDTVLVWSPRYDERLVDVMKRVPRQWDAARKCYVVQAGFKPSLWRALQSLSGWGYGPKGPFKLGT